MMVCVNKFNIVDSTATYFEEELLCYIMKSTVDNYEEKHKKTLLTTCREQKSTRREGGGVNFRTGKL